MKKLTKEEKEKALGDHHEALTEMREDVEEINGILGRNHTAAVKLRKVLEIMESFTEQEIFDLSTLEDSKDNEVNSLNHDS